MRQIEVKLLIVSPSMCMMRQSVFCNSVTMGSFYCALVMTLPSCCYRWVFLMIEVAEIFKRLETWAYTLFKVKNKDTRAALIFLVPLLLTLDRYIHICWSACNGGCFYGSFRKNVWNFSSVLNFFPEMLYQCTFNGSSACTVVNFKKYAFAKTFSIHRRSKWRSKIVEKISRFANASLFFFRYHLSIANLNPLTKRARDLGKFEILTVLPPFS